MSLKAEIEAWVSALEAYDAQNFEKALESFEIIADSSKILFNIALIHATLGNHEVAVENYNASNALDQYLAVSYFQCGVSNFLLGRYEEAKRDFEDAFQYLRGNMTIDYEQLGLKFRLYSCEVLFNRGISLIYMGMEEEGLADLAEARNQKQTPEHGVIDEAFEDRGDGYTVFSIPVGILYRPSEKKVKNLKQKNYLGQAKLVAASDSRDAFTGFTGSQRANSSDGPSSAGPRSGPSSSSIDLARSKTAAARIEGGDDEPSAAVAALRRRPTDNTASITPAPAQRTEQLRPMDNLQRSASANLLSLPTGSRATPGPPRATPTPSGGRDTQFVDDLLDEYAEYPPPMPPVPQGQPKDRVADWAAQNARAPTRSASTRVGGSGGRSRGFNSGGGGSFRRAPSTRAPRRQRTLDEYDDEGYEEDVFEEREMVKVRIKIQYAGDTRAMSISPTTQLEDFIDRLKAKFDLTRPPQMKFKDEDGTYVSIKDDDDWESAIDEARAQSKGREEGKLEITLKD